MASRILNNKSILKESMGLPFADMLRHRVDILDNQFVWMKIICYSSNYSFKTLVPYVVYWFSTPMLPEKEFVSFGLCSLDNRMS